jgi:Dissimilatory sulfite reductase (desulfoviridin), alpha and beta subunits
VPTVNAEKCRGCVKCRLEEACPMKSMKVVEGIIQVDKTICNNCGRCIGKCMFNVVDEGTPGFKVYIGGRWGKQTAQGMKLGKIFKSEEDVLNVLEKTILLFREKGKTGERLAQTIERLGFKNVEKMLDSDDILSRKQQIIDAPLNM